MDSLVQAYRKVGAVKTPSGSLPADSRKMEVAISSRVQ
jgi:hypothetical protein